MPEDQPKLTASDYPLTCKSMLLHNMQLAVTMFLDKESKTVEELRDFYGRDDMQQFIMEMLYRGMFDLKNFMDQAKKLDELKPEEGEE